MVLYNIAAYPIHGMKDCLSSHALESLVTGIEAKLAELSLAISGLSHCGSESEAWKHWDFRGEPTYIRYKMDGRPDSNRPLHFEYGGPFLSRWLNHDEEWLAIYSGAGMIVNIKGYGELTHVHQDTWKSKNGSTHNLTFENCTTPTPPPPPPPPPHDYWVRDYDIWRECTCKDVDYSAGTYKSKEACLKAMCP